MRRRRDWILLVFLQVVCCQYIEKSKDGYNAVPIPSVVLPPAPPLPPRAPTARGYQPPPHALLFEGPRSYYQNQNGGFVPASNRPHHHQSTSQGRAQFQNRHNNFNFAPPKPHTDGPPASRPHPSQLNNRPPIPSHVIGQVPKVVHETVHVSAPAHVQNHNPHGVDLGTVQRPKSSFGLNSRDQWVTAARPSTAPGTAATPSWNFGARPRGGNSVRVQPKVNTHRIGQAPDRNRGSFATIPGFVPHRHNPPTQQQVDATVVNSREKNMPNMLNNIIVHIYLSAKDRSRPSHAQTKIGPIHGAFGIGTSHGGPGTHSDPIVITKDFDRDRLQFVEQGMAEMMAEDGSSNIVEVHAMVSSPDQKIKKTLDKAVNTELDRSIPVVLERFHGTMAAMDDDLRQELEQALVDEIARNLGDTIDEMSEVTEEDLGALIEEGFNAIEAEMASSTTRSPAPTTRRITVTSSTATATTETSTKKTTKTPMTNRVETTPTTTRRTTTVRPTTTTTAPPTSTVTTPETAPSTSRTPPPRTYRIRTTTPTTTAPSTTDRTTTLSQVETTTMAATEKTTESTTTRTTTTEKPTTHQTVTTTKPTTTVGTSTTQPSTTTTKKQVPVDFEHESVPETHSVDQQKEPTSTNQPIISKTTKTASFAEDNMMRPGNHPMETTVLPETNELNTVTIPLPTSSEERELETFVPPFATESGEQLNIVTSRPITIVNIEESGEVPSISAPATQDGGTESSTETTPVDASSEQTTKLPGASTSAEERDEDVEPLPDSVVMPNGACPTPNDLSDRNKSDVLFLLDSSNSFNEDKFMHAITLILHTVDQFNNIGPDGIQVSLVQYNNDPYLEFSLRKHNCKQFLKDDIADTDYMMGGQKLGKALEKVSKFAFTKKRGDRPDAENILVIVTDGQSDDRVQQPITIARDNNVTVLVIATLEADPNYLMKLTGDVDNVFHLDGTPNQPLAYKLADRINRVSNAPPSKTGAEDGMVIVPHRQPIDANELEEERPVPSMHIISSNDPLGMVHLICASGGFKINFNVPSSFAGHAVVKGQENEDSCKKDIRPTNNAGNQTVEFFVAKDACGMTEVTSLNPPGANQTLILQLLHDPSLRTDIDRAFLLQCFTGVSETETELSTNLDVVKSEVMIAETISLSSIPPTCTYSIRKDSPHGAVIAKATVGQKVYHRWDCDGGDLANNVYGIQIHNCYASDDIEQKYPIVDATGCSSDISVLADPVYEDDKLSAYAESHAFGFKETESLKFVCKLSLCTRDGDGCEGVTPPTCNSNHSDLLFTRRIRHQNSALETALTSALSTEVGLSTGSLHEKIVDLAGSQYIWVLAIMTIVAIVVTVFVSRHAGGSDASTSCSDTEMGSGLDVTRDSSSEFNSSASEGPSTISGPPVNPRLAEFMRTFDRDRYV